MPSFTVRRRKRREPTPPPETEDPVEEEEDETMTPEASDDDEYVDAAIEELKQTRITPQTAPDQRRPQRRYAQPGQNEFRPQIAHRPPVNRQSVPQRQPHQRLNDPYTRKPTMMNSFERPKLNRRGARLRYRSHYGPNGSALDTHTKASLLYTHCFG